MYLVGLFSQAVLLAPQLHSHFTKLFSVAKVPTTPPIGGTFSFSIFQPRKCWRAFPILTLGFVRPVAPVPASLPCGSQQMPDQDAHGNAQGKALTGEGERASVKTHPPWTLLKLRAAFLLGKPMQGYATDPNFCKS